MYILLFFALLISTASACSSKEISVKFCKHSTGAGSIEWWFLFSPLGDDLLYESWIPSNSGTDTKIVCIPKRADCSYDLVVYGKNGREWSNGSYLEVYDTHDNLLLKTGWTENLLHFTIKELIPYGDPFYSSTVIYDGWQNLHYSNDGWSYSSSLTQETNSNIYLRKDFNGFTGAAAYELFVQTKYPFVAYMNGFEIFKYTKTTTNSVYVSIIRSGDEIRYPRNIVAIKYNAGIYNPSVALGCYLIVHGTTVYPGSGSLIYKIPMIGDMRLVNPSGDDDLNYLVDYNPGTMCRITAAGKQLEMEFTFSDRRYVQATGYFAYTSEKENCLSFSLFAKDSSSYFSDYYDFGRECFTSLSANGYRIKPNLYSNTWKIRYENDLTGQTVIFNEIELIVQSQFVFDPEGKVYESTYSVITNNDFFIVPDYHYYEKCTCSCNSNSIKVEENGVVYGMLLSEGTYTCSVTCQVDDKIQPKQSFKIIAEEGQPLRPTSAPTPKPAGIPLVLWIIIVVVIVILIIVVIVIVILAHTLKSTKKQLQKQIKKNIENNPTAV